MDVDVEVKAKATEIDRLVHDFVRIVEKYTNYAIVSGYVAILLGMERPTQDVMIFLKRGRKNRYLYQKTVVL